MATPPAGSRRQRHCPEGVNLAGRAARQGPSAKGVWHGFGCRGCCLVQATVWIAKHRKGLAGRTGASFLMAFEPAIGAATVAWHRHQGCERHQVSQRKTRVELLKAIHDRIVEQRLLYGERSSAPMYVVQTQEDRELAERPIRIAVVQPMLPRRDQFNDKEPCRWTEKLMEQHRRHLAEVCRLTYQKLRTRATAQYPRDERNNHIEPLVDLILFPELSVHPEHVFHLRVLSDKVKATIFAGLTFIDSPKHLTPIN